MERWSSRCAITCQSRISALCSIHHDPRGTYVTQGDGYRPSVVCRSETIAHSSGWFHGDARYPNAIETPEKTILWIDLLNASTHDGDPAALVQDKITLGLSCLGELSAEDETTLTGNMYEAHASDDDSYAKSFAIVSKLHHSCFTHWPVFD